MWDRWKFTLSWLVYDINNTMVWNLVAFFCSATNTMGFEEKKLNSIHPSFEGEFIVNMVEICLKLRSTFKREFLIHPDSDWKLLRWTVPLVAMRWPRLWTCLMMITMMKKMTMMVMLKRKLKWNQGHFQKRDSNYGLEEIVKMFARTRFGNKYFRKAGQLFNNWSPRQQRCRTQFVRCASITASKLDSGELVDDIDNVDDIDDVDDDNNVEDEDDQDSDDDDDDTGDDPHTCASRWLVTHVSTVIDTIADLFQKKIIGKIFFSRNCSQLMIARPETRECIFDWKSRSMSGEDIRARGGPNMIWYDIIIYC